MVHVWAHTIKYSLSVEKHKNFNLGLAIVIRPPPPWHYFEILMHSSVEPNFIFLRNCIWLNIFSLLWKIKIRACKQRHHYFELAWIPLKLSILIFWDNLSIVYCKLRDSRETSLHISSKYLMYIRFCLKWTGVFMIKHSKFSDSYEWFDTVLCISNAI